jgi:hypothetical protein
MEDLGSVEVHKSPSPVRTRDSSPKRSSDSSHPPAAPIGQSDNLKKTTRQHEEQGAEQDFRTDMAQLFMFGTKIFDKENQTLSETNLVPISDTVRDFRLAVRQRVEVHFPNVPLKIDVIYEGHPSMKKGHYLKFTWVTDRGIICVAVLPQSDRVTVEWAEQAKQLEGLRWKEDCGPWSRLDISPDPQLFWDHAITTKDGDIEDECGLNDSPILVVDGYLDGILAGTAITTNLNELLEPSLDPIPPVIEQWRHSILMMVEALFPKCSWNVTKVEETFLPDFLGWYNIYVSDTKHGFIVVYVLPKSDQVTIEWSMTKDRQSERTYCSLDISPTPGKYWDHVIELADGKNTDKNGASENPTIVVRAFLDAIAGDYPLHVRLPRA